MKARYFIAPLIGAPCIVAMPLPFPIKLITAAILGYFTEWLFEFIDDHRDA